MALTQILKLSPKMIGKYWNLSIRLQRLYKYKPQNRGYRGRLMREGTQLEEAREYARNIINNKLSEVWH